jgi:hypothetical protein
MYVLYYASMLWCWHIVWILVRSDYPCLEVGCHSNTSCYSFANYLLITFISSSITHQILG